MSVERPQQFLTPFADDFELSDTFEAGEVRVVTGLKDARTGDTLVAKDGARARLAERYRAVAAGACAPTG